MQNAGTKKQLACGEQRSGGFEVLLLRLWVIHNTVTTMPSPEKCCLLSCLLVQCKPKAGHD